MKVEKLNEIKDQPFSKLSDEKIARLLMDRFGSKAILIVFDEGKSFAYLGKHKSDAKLLLSQFKNRLKEDKFEAFKEL